MRLNSPLFSLYAGAAVTLTTFLVLFYHQVQTEYHDFEPRGVSDFVPRSNITLENYEQILDTITPENATALFKTVLNTLRQKGSDLNPVGVAMTPALVPRGTFMYHGSGGKPPVNPGWIAFDAVFSYDFAGNLPEYNESLNIQKRNLRIGSNFSHHFHYEGQLYTFESVEDLSMIYLDGASASKIVGGPIDTLLILAHEDGTYPEDTYFAHDKTPVRKACAWAEKLGIDGFIRLETGFEGILCNITGPKVKIISNVSMADANQTMGFPTLDSADLVSNEMQPIRKFYNDLNRAASFDHMQAAINVYDGDPRIYPDFSGMVTAINRTYVSPDPYDRRLLNISEDVKNGMIKDLEEYGRHKRLNPYVGANWQVLTDLFVKRFTPVLLNLNHSYARYIAHPNKQEYDYLAHNLTLFTVTIFRQFMNVKDIPKKEKIYRIPEDMRRDAIRRLVYEHSRPQRQAIRTPMDRLIWSAIAKVAEITAVHVFDSAELASRMVRGLYDMKPPSRNVPINTIRYQAKALADTVKLFDWPNFYRCAQMCAWNEICVVPTWGPGPLGWNLNLTHKTTFDEITCVNIYDVDKKHWD